MMDDTPDKLRRNVVVLSAAILAIASFHLSFKPTGTLLGFAEVGNVSAFKVWLALSAVLAYAFLRYRFDAATGESLSAMRDEFDRFVKLAVTHRAERAVSRYLIQGTQPWLPYWIRDIDRFVDQVAKDAAFLGTDTRPVSAEIRATRRELSRDSDLFCDEADSPWRGEFTFTYAAQWEFDGGTSFGSCGGYSKSAYITKCTSWVALCSSLLRCCARRIRRAPSTWYCRLFCRGSQCSSVYTRSPSIFPRPVSEHDSPVTRTTPAANPFVALGAALLTKLHTEPADFAILAGMAPATV